MNFYNSFNELAAANCSGPLQSQMSIFNASTTKNMGVNDGAETTRINKEINALKAKIRSLQGAPANTEEDCKRLEEQVKGIEKEIKSLEVEKIELRKRGSSAMDGALYPDPIDENPVARVKPPAESIHLPNIRKPKDDDDGSWMPSSTRNKED